jgi:hypothetical protein
MTTPDNNELVEIVARALDTPEGTEYMPRMREFAALALTAIESSGRRIVPVEPTPTIDAGEIVRVGIATAGENLVPNPRLRAALSQTAQEGK